MGVKHGLTRREEHGLRVFEIRVLRVIYGPEWERFQRNEEDYSMSRNQTNTKILGVCSMHGEMNLAYLLFRKPEGKDRLEDPGQRRVGNMKTDFQTKNRMADMDWTDLVWDRDMWLVLKTW